MGGGYRGRGGGRIVGTGGGGAIAYLRDGAFDGDEIVRQLVAGGVDCNTQADGTDQHQLIRNVTQLSAYLYDLCDGRVATRAWPLHTLTSTRGMTYSSLCKSGGICSVAGGLVGGSIFGSPVWNCVLVLWLYTAMGIPCSR